MEKKMNKAQKVESWIYEEEKKSNKKKHKAFRDQRKSKRNIWESD